jgi:hypothetical protein
MKKALRLYAEGPFSIEPRGLYTSPEFGKKLQHSRNYENFSLQTAKIGRNYFFLLAAPFLAGAFFFALDAFFLAAINTSSKTLAAFDPGSLRRALPQSTATPPLNASHHRKVL